MSALTPIVALSAGVANQLIWVFETATEPGLLALWGALLLTAGQNFRTRLATRAAVQELTDASSDDMLISGVTPAHSAR